MSTVTVTSFGYLHGEPPAAHITLDLRHHFRDPHVNPALRELTAHDAPVRDAVLATQGIPDLINATIDLVRAYQDGPAGGDVDIAVGCAGGRHRAATVAAEIADALGDKVTLTHRDLGKPVVNR